jgi:hypothetical protein
MEWTDTDESSRLAAAEEEECACLLRPEAEATRRFGVMNLLVEHFFPGALLLFSLLLWLVPEMRDMNVLQVVPSTLLLLVWCAASCAVGAIFSHVSARLFAPVRRRVIREVRYASVLADPAAERAADHGREASLSLLPVRDAGRTADCAFLARVCRNHALPLLFNALTIFGGTAAGCFRSERLGWLLGLLVLLLAVTSLVAALGYWEWQERILVRECRRRQLLRKRAEKRLPDALGMLS